MAGGYDTPLINFSSEPPDTNIHVAVDYGNPQDPPALGKTYDTPGCVAWCTSTVSQSEADLCAAAQQETCSKVTTKPPGGPPGGGGGGPPGGPPGGGGGGGGTQGPIPGTNPTIYGNAPQTCNATCPDGTKFSQTVNAGEVIARSQALADDQANSIACQRAAQNKMCFGSIKIAVCKGATYDEILGMDSIGPGVIPPITYSLDSGTLPTGVNLSSASPAFADSASLYGTIPNTGNSTFSIKATSANGKTATKSFTISVLGFTTTSLGSGVVGTPYSAVLKADGGTPPYTFAWDGFNALPPGLGVLPSGGITGTPSQIGTFQAGFAVKDSTGFSCTKVIPMTIGGTGNAAQTSYCPNNPSLSATTPANTYSSPNPLDQNVTNCQALVAAFNKLSAAGCANCGAQVNAVPRTSASVTTTGTCLVVVYLTGPGGIGYPGSYATLFGFPSSGTTDFAPSIQSAQGSPNGGMVGGTFSAWSQPYGTGNLLFSFTLPSTGLNAQPAHGPNY